jgi:uncharacterized protein (TIGR02246 family)
MRAGRSIATLASLALVVPALAAEPDVRRAIEQRNAEFAAGVARGDAAALAGMYTSDAMVLPPNGEVTRGHAAIEVFWRQALASGVRRMTLTTLEAEAHGDTAYEVGTYAMSGDADREIDRGKYVVVWRRDRGRWQLHRDIWNTSVPPPGREHP